MNINPFATKIRTAVTTATLAFAASAFTENETDVSTLDIAKAPGKLSCNHINEPDKDSFDSYKSFCDWSLSK